MKTWTKTWMTLPLIAPLALACGEDPTLESEQDPASDTASTPEAEMAREEESGLEAVASIRLENGNLVEFFDAVNGGVVTETGLAGVTPTIQVDGDRNFVRLWKKLARGKPVPRALSDLQAELVVDSEPQPRASTETMAAAPRVSQGGGSGTGEGPKALTWCNNGCCDYDWLVNTFQTCRNGDWFLLNKGWSWANAWNIVDYWGVVCSASGTSEFEFNVAGNPPRFVHWPVPEGRFRIARWVGKFTVLWPCWGFCRGNLTSSVNSPSAPRLHTYCGDVAF